MHVFLRFGTFCLVTFENRATNCPYFLHLRGAVYLFFFIFHTLGVGGSESMEISILLFFFLNPSLKSFTLPYTTSQQSNKH